MTDTMVSYFTVGTILFIALNVLYLGAIFAVKNSIKENLKELQKHTELLKFLSKKANQG